MLQMTSWRMRRCARRSTRRISLAAADPNNDQVSRLQHRICLHSLFIKFASSCPAATALSAGIHRDMTIIDIPSFQPTIASRRRREAPIPSRRIDFPRKIVLICGSSLCGRDGRVVFTTLKLLPAGPGPSCRCHCSANVRQDWRSALFFGLSGTGNHAVG